jgi:hypothetical protein
MTEPEAGRRAREAASVGFIVGPARSGTTLLYKALCLHPDAAWISNWLARFPKATSLAALDRIARWFPGAARRAWFEDGSNAYVYGRHRPLRRRVFPMPVEGEPVYRAAGVDAIGSELATTEVRRSLVASFDAIRRGAGGTCVISKRIANVRRIPFLREAFPEARFVAMVRDGRAVALSLSTVDWWRDSTVWWYGDTPAAWEAEGRDPWELCARNWVEEIRAVRDGLRAVPADRVLWLRYEDLVADPMPELSRVARFLGLEPSSRWDAQLGALSFPDRNERWRQQLPSDAIATVTAFQRDELEGFGYGD